jgi:hypothetical protein
MRLFGSAPPPAVTPADSIKKLRNTIDMLDKREVFNDYILKE